jgi:hypothetical protein
MTQEIYYPKTKELLYSMALRYDHGFGFYEKEKQDQIVKKMDKLYDLYVQGKSNKQISEELSIHIVHIEQIREEVNGKGFFKPTDENKYFYNGLKK